MKGTKARVIFLLLATKEEGRKRVHDTVGQHRCLRGYSLSCAAMISPVTLVALDREREAARGHARDERAGDGTMVPSCSVFQACLGRAGSLIARDSRFEVAPPMFSGRLDSLPLRDEAHSFFSPSLSFSLFAFHLLCDS